MKDPKDPGTVDGLPGKVGRPCKGAKPMTAAERKRASRAGIRAAGFEEITFRAPAAVVARLQELARRSDMLPGDVIAQLVTAAKLPRKPR